MNIIQSVLSSKNQVVIPAQIRRALKLTSGDKLIWRVAKMKNQSKVIAEPAPKSWAKYSRGLGKNIWQKVSILEYIENLRSEWQK